MSIKFYREKYSVAEKKIRKLTVINEILPELKGISSDIITTF